MKKSDKKEEIVAQQPKPLTLAEELWGYMKNMPMSFVGLTHTVQDFIKKDSKGEMCVYTNLDPDKIYLELKVSGMVPSLEEVMNILQNSSKMKKLNRKFKPMEQTETGMIILSTEKINILGK